MGLLARRPRRAAPWRPGAAASRRASIAVAVVLVAASGVAIFGSRAISQETASAKTAARASDLYQEARFWAARQDAKLTEYLMNGDPNAKDLYEEAAESLTNSLTKIESVQDAPAIRGLLDDQRTYTAQAVKLFALADSATPRPSTTSSGSRPSRSSTA